jgi:CheY-like chemotaxis protein
VIIALTASAFDSDRKIILSEGCDDFLRKPLVEEEVYEMLEKHLGVIFTLEEESMEPSGDKATVALTPELLRDIPEAWRASFLKATVQADYAALRQLLDELRPLHAEATAALGTLVDRFEYQKIIAALEG